MNKITILVPAFNEDETLRFFYERVTGVLTNLVGYTYEILFVNDGSKDNTREIIKSFREHDKCVSYVNLSRNFGNERATAFIEEKQIPKDEINYIGGDLNVMKNSNEYSTMTDLLNVSQPTKYTGHSSTWDPTTNSIAQYNYPDLNSQYLDYIFVEKTTQHRITGI
ncbi:glycosyltransferase [Halobacillus shinanisalinarum]|uniref:Glycosyltransferase n=1 Tax=Halobacillus shinanisalinarum TaxID=2932258 RepID=A0ABY4GVX7_9BACI|nr:glycosyltransferase [Halobacillus shinanisalinarum]UOQ91880.1 glycosyltransferase [Halobacillus shinanisalinarum]